MRGLSFSNRIRRPSARLAYIRHVRPERFAGDDCIDFHVKAAVDRGATLEEVLETSCRAVYMGTGPSAMYASHALGAYAQFAASKADAA
jgi:alkylhydroperoxidase/carboxymuconolactone decarboxylase family protein YurZ